MTRRGKAVENRSADETARAVTARGLPAGGRDSDRSGAGLETGGPGQFCIAARAAVRWLRAVWMFAKREAFEPVFANSK